MKVTILGLSITSSWGNGHATNYRALVRALEQHGDEVTFLERDMPWYAQHRDLPQPPWGHTSLYGSAQELRRRHADVVCDADLVVVGSFVPDGVEVIEWVREHAGGAVAFYDIDTPVTLGKLRSGGAEYLHPDQVAGFDLYLSFTAGPALELLRSDFGARRPTGFYCFVDPAAYTPVAAPQQWALNYLGTYSPGRQPAVDELLLAPARLLPRERFAVAGPMYPAELAWPENVERIVHLPPSEHPRFYCSASFTLNVTRPEMRELGFSPSVRLFEAAACGAPIISDEWPGLESVLRPGEQVLIARGCDDVLAMLELDESERRRVGSAARERVLAEHTAQRRVEQLHELLAAAGSTSTGVAR